MKKDHINMFAYFYKVKGWVLFLIGIMVAGSLIDVFSPIIQANLVTYLTDFSYQKAITFAIFLLIISIIKVTVSEITNILYFKKIKRKLSFHIRKDMIENIFHMKIKNFDIHTSGEFSERLKEDPENISSILSIVQYSAISIMTDIIILGFIFYIHFSMGIVYLLYVIIIYFYEKKAFQKYEKNYEEYNKLREKNGTLLNETMRGIRDIKKLNISTPIFQLISRNLDETTKKDANQNIIHGRIYNTVEIIKALATVSIILLGIYLVSIGKLSSKNLIIIFMYRANVFDLVLCYTSIKEYYAKYKVSSARIFELCKEENYPKEKFGKKKLTNIEGKIEIKNLSFTYQDKEILKDINMLIKKGDTIAIVGASGSGKTTLMSLLSKSYDVEDNKIWIDDIDINQLTEGSIRDNISVITQDPYLFHLSIKENLQLVKEDAKEKEIVEACKIAKIHDYINSLPNGYDTVIGEGGTLLSGGQKQRLAIARALLKKSKIILLDEATSALDNITQSEIQKEINAIAKNHTIIIIAHRLSTIKDCNPIFVLENGKIVDQGTHEKLLKTSKSYQKLYEKETPKNL